jgi:hypothetical protein
MMSMTTYFNTSEKYPPLQETVKLGVIIPSCNAIKPFKTLNVEPGGYLSPCIALLYKGLYGSFSKIL